jgi:hypothetical protein
MKEATEVKIWKARCTPRSLGSRKDEIMFYEDSWKSPEELKQIAKITHTRPNDLEQKNLYEICRLMQKVYPFELSQEEWTNLKVGTEDYEQRMMDEEKELELEVLDETWDKLREAKDFLFEDLNKVETFDVNRLHQISPETRQMCDLKMDLIECGDALARKLKKKEYLQLLDKVYYSLSKDEKSGQIRETLENLSKNNQLKRSRKPLTKRAFERLLKDAEQEKEKKQWQGQYETLIKSKKPWEALNAYKCMKSIGSRRKSQIYDFISYQVGEPLLVSILKDSANVSGCLAGRSIYLLNSRALSLKDTFLVENTVSSKKCGDKPLQFILLSYYDSPRFDPKALRKMTQLEREQKWHERKIPISEEDRGHALAILVDKKHKTIEVYDPHGMASKESRVAWAAALRDVLPNEYRDLHRYKLVEFEQGCPRGFAGMQSILNIPQCVNFVFLYLLSRILSPNSSREQILQNLSSQNVKQLQSELAHLLCFQYDYARYNKYMAANYLLHLVQGQQIGPTPMTVIQAKTMLKNGEPQKVIQLLTPYLGGASSPTPPRM